MCTCLADGCAFWTLLAGIIISALLAIYSLGMTTGLKSATVGRISALSDIRNTLTDASSIITDGLGVSVRDASMDAQVLYDQAAGVPLPSAILGFIAATSTQASIAAAAGQVDGLGSQVGIAESAAWKGWEKAGQYSGVDLDSLPDKAVGYFVGAAIGYCVIALIIIACLLGNRSASIAFRALGAPLLILWTLVIFCICGAFTTFALAGADACVNPNRAVQLVLNETSGVSGLSPDVLLPTVTWYAQGACSNDAIPPSKQCRCVVATRPGGHYVGTTTAC